MLAGLAFATGLAAGSVSAETVIHYSHGTSSKGTIPATLKWYSNRVAELTEGDVRVELQWGSALFKPGSAVQSIGDGVADAGTVIASYFPKEMAAYTISDLPVSGLNLWVALKAIDQLMRGEDQIAEHLAHNNLVYIATFTGSAVNIACSGDPITTVEDIKGKRIRGTGVYGKVFDALGATRVNLSVFEAYQALDTGLIDCTQGYTYVIPVLKWDEVVDNYTILNWGQLGGAGFFMNKQFFDAMSKDNQTAVLQAGREMTDVYARTVIEVNDKILKRLRKGEGDNKIEVIDFGEADTARLKTATQPFIDEWRRNAESVGLDPESLMNSFVPAVDKFTREYEAEGYPWARLQ